MEILVLLFAGAAIGSVLGAYLCWQKGKTNAALAGAVALPSAVVIFFLGRADLADSTGGLDDLGAAIGYALLMLLVAGGLGLISLIGAIRLARPDSPYAETHYSPAEMERARERYGD